MSLILRHPCDHLKTAVNKRLYDILTFAAKINILLQWVSDKIPSVCGWRKIIFELIPRASVTVDTTSVDQFYSVAPIFGLYRTGLSSILLKRDCCAQNSLIMDKCTQKGINARKRTA